MKKILVLDDDVDILTLMKMTLSMNDFDVETISRWEHVYNTISNFEPDLILLDVSLGDADGRDICKRIKQTKETQHIPVVLFSANSEMAKSVNDCQAEAFIAKPYKLSNLLETIKTHIN